MNRKNARELGYWIATALAVLLFAVPGAALLIRNAHFASEMARLGYPAYFLTILGALKILGALVILVPGFRRLKEWAYAGLMFDVLGAVLSRLAMGDPAAMLVVPLLVGALALFSWALRPAARTLPDAPIPTALEAQQ
jgi:uncharacterized membrane protein YphA (DoxX/SURF4 family)